MGNEREEPGDGGREGKRKGKRVEGLERDRGEATERTTILNDAIQKSICIALDPASSLTSR